MFDNNFCVIEPENLINDKTWSEAYLNGQVHASPVSDRVVRVLGPMPVWPLAPGT